MIKDILKIMILMKKNYKMYDVNKLMDKLVDFLLLSKLYSSIIF